VPELSNFATQITQDSLFDVALKVLLGVSLIAIYASKVAGLGELDSH
jgi:hypothetical protein